MSSSLNNLSAATEDRKARLAALRGLKRKQPNGETATPEAENRPSQPAAEGVDIARQHLSGRNYDFETKGPKLGFEHMPNEGLENPTLEEQAAEVEAETQRLADEEAQNEKGIDLFKLQPKKPNWDLKRNLETKMEILNVRTDNAIAKLVRQRIASAQEAVQKGGAARSDAVEGDAVGLDGLALVEGLRVREKEEREEEERERAQEE
ncbi:mRNA splicing factor, Cwf18 [Drechmeria coniospora]|uniref:mRNA splicing factor, Cwf18 n=1 Tax=Drechmeria coniospora TaxID=98403 RepID=A0A151GTA4_DRECN|nr:mRNA splicing factor, Cwf18 [Drechmeria coniospora]KYK60354.1 mRNA splicing factor, Cwf18 [Drechmeria coniospora]